MNWRVLFLLPCCTIVGARNVQWADVPLSFEPNRGQAPSQVLYLARTALYTVYVAGDELVLAGRHRRPMRMTLSGSSKPASVAGEGPQASTSNYFIGSDSDKWRPSLPNYDKVRSAGVYPGIDLVCYGKDGQLEYDWVVSPGADPSRIHLKFEGADRVRTDRNGDLVVNLGESEYRHRKPVVYQNVEGQRVAVAGNWVVSGAEARFRISAYRHDRELVIDPALIYSTYQGGSGAEYAYAIAVDQSGNTYVVGSTGSTNFPTAGPFDASLGGAQDVFVAKYNSTGTARFFSTYLGSGGPDEGRGIAVDSHGNVYVTGSAGFSDFPMVNPIQGVWGGSGDAFVTKINASGTALVYSTYLGGSSIDTGRAIAVDPAGNAYIAGITFSTNFPTVSPFQAAKGSLQDAFVAKINPSGTAWVYATYLGGNNVDEAYAIAADTSGNAYVTGYTASTNFPLQSPVRASNLNTVDAFVTKLNPAGSALVYSTYLGGSGTDYGTGIAVDASGDAYVTGILGLGSNDFPITSLVQSNAGGSDDAFISKFNAAGSALVYSTFVGGGSADQPAAIAVDQSGNAYITGRTNSSDFPLTNPIQATRVAFDIFVTEINATATARLFSTFIGGAGDDGGLGIAVDSRGNIHVAGHTTSTDFPVLHPLQATNGGDRDAAVLLIGDSPWPAPAPLGFLPVPPCRVADTRASQAKTGAFGPPALAAYVTRNLPVLQGGCGMDGSALAYSLNFTVVPPGPLDFLSVWPSGQPYPGVSTLNSPDGNVIANAAIVPGGAAGSVAVVAGQQTDLIVDANGYFAPPNGSELAFYPLTPCRIADTRTGQGKTGAFGPPALAAYNTRIFPVLQSACGVPSAAKAYALNLTVVPHGPLSFLSVWPAAQPYPGVSTLNAPDGSIVANAAIVPAGTSGSVNVVAGEPTDLIMDINGYFAAAGGQGGLHFYPLTPCRILDTRSSQRATGTFGPPALAAYVSRDVPVASAGCDIPPTARAYSLNFTAIPSGPLDFLSVWPADQSYPGVSTLNSPKGATLANAAIVPASPTGDIKVVAGAATDLIIDINGYFAP